MKKIFAGIIALLVVKSILAQSVGGSVGGSTTVCSGTNSGIVTLSGHTGNVVRWQSSTSSGASWTNISNTTVNLVYSNLNTTTWYRAEVLLAPSPPNVSAFSTPGIITVDAPSSGTISSSTSVCTGTNSGTLSLGGTFTSVAGWESSADGGGTWNPISNTTTSQNYSNLTITTLYRATVTNGTCPASITPAATITVNPLSVGGSISGAVTVCGNANSGTLVLNGNTGSVIRWQSSDDMGISWSNITNTTGAGIYNFSNIDQTMQYRAVVQSGNCGIVNSAIATVTVNPSSAGGTISSDATVCSGTNNGTLVLGGQTGNIIRWESSVNGGSTWSKIINSTASHNYNNLTVNTIYRALVKSGICDSAYSANATITVAAPSVGGTIAGSDTVCSGSNSGTLVLSGNTGDVIRWQSSTDGGISWSNISNTASAQNYSNLSNATDYRAVVQNATCPTANSSAASVSLFPLSAGGTLSPSGYSVCSGINSGTILLTGQTGNVIGWEYSTNGGTTWNSITNTSASQNYLNLTVITKYRAIVQNAPCAAARSSISTINVSPVSNGGIVSGSDTVCTGSNSGTLTLTGYTGSVQNWEYSANGGLTWSNISNSTAIQNYTNLTSTTQYRAVVQSGSCASANSVSGKITVSPKSAGGTVFSNSFVCDSNTTGTLTLSGYTGSILNWESSIDNGITWTSIANPASTQIYSGITKNTLYRAHVQSGACAASFSDSAAISIAAPVMASYTFSVNGATVIFSNTSITNAGTSFWSFGDNTSSSITSPAHTYIANGTYTVQLIIADSCGSDTAIHTVTIAGLAINELTYNNSNVKVYPNPFSSITTMALDFEVRASTLKVCDMYGKEVRNIQLDRGTKSLQLERGDLAEGIYFYKIQSEEGTIATGKIVIR